MACRIALRSVILTELRLPPPSINDTFSSFNPFLRKSASNFSCGCRIALNSKSYQFRRYCSNKGDSSSSADDSEQGPPQEAVLKAISGLYFSAESSFNQWLCVIFFFTKNFMFLVRCIVVFTILFWEYPILEWWDLLVKIVQARKLKSSRNSERMGFFSKKLYRELFLLNMVC